MARPVGRHFSRTIGPDRKLRSLVDQREDPPDFGVPLAIFQTVLQASCLPPSSGSATASRIWLEEVSTHLASKTESTMDDQIVKLVARTLKLFAVLTGVILAAQISASTWYPSWRD